MINLYRILQNGYRTLSECIPKKGWLLVGLLLLAKVTLAQFTIKETFAGSSVDPDNPIVMGGTAQLTAQTGNDPVGSGMLRLTDLTGNQTGYAFIDKSFPSSLGVMLEFDFLMWGSGAQCSGDGLSVWLFDGSIPKNQFRLGPYGGPLGYYRGCESDRNFYLNGGQVVVALDYYGEFTHWAKNTPACFQTTNSLSSDAIVIGGMSSAPSYIASAGNIGLNYSVALARPTENQYYRRVRMVVTKPDANGARRVICYLKKSPDVLFTRVAEGNYTSILSSTLKVGFAGTSGGCSQYQEIRNLYSTTADNLSVNTKVGEGLKEIKDGDVASWSVTVDNLSSAAANGALLKNSLAAGYTLQSTNKIGGDAAITNGIQSVGEQYTLTYFPSYGQAMVSYKGVMDQVPDGVKYVVLSAGITAPAGYVDNDPSNDNSSDTLWMLRPDLSITQMMSEPSLYLGSPRNLTLHVSNDAGARLPATGGVTITDTLPDGLLPDNIPTSINGWTVSVQGNVITATRSDDLAIGASYPDVVLPVRVALNATPGTVHNRAGVKADNQKELDTTNSYSNQEYTISVAGVLNASIDKTTIPEDPGSGNAGKVSFQLDKSWGVDANVYWHITGSAATGVDYSVSPAVQGSVVSLIPAGQTILDHIFTATDDGLLEGAETIGVIVDSVILADRTYIGVMGSPLDITVLDKQFQGVGGTGGNCTRLSSPSGQVYYARVEKVQDGKVPGTPVIFRFSLDIASATAVTVDYQLSGTAVKGTHYDDPDNGTLLLGPGESSKELSLPVADNNRVEDKVVDVSITDAKTSLTDGSCVQYGVDSVTGKSSGTISGDKSKLVLSVKALSDGAEPGTPAKFVVSWPAGVSSGTDTKLSYTLGGTAVKGVDYTDPGELIFAAGHQSDTITIAVIDNNVIDGDRTLAFGLQAGEYTIDAANGSATVKILDDEDDDTPDKRAARQLCISKTNGVEGGANGQFVIGFRDATLTASKDLRITYSDVGSTAELNKDYTAFTTEPGLFVLKAGQNSITTDVVITDDHLAEPTEQLVVTLTGVQSDYEHLVFEAGVGCDKAVLSITDNDKLELGLSNGGNITEGETGSFTIAVKGAVQLDKPLELKLTYTHNEEQSYSIGGTTLPITYEHTLMMQPGENLQDLIQSIDNQVHDEPGFVQLQVQLGDHGDLQVSFTGDTVSTIIVSDNDPLSISWMGGPEVKRVEGSGGDYSDMTFQITMSRVSSRPVAVKYIIDNAIAGISPQQKATLKSMVSGLLLRFADVDDTGGDSQGQHTIMIDAGQMEGRVDILVQEDSIFERDEQFRLTITEGRMQLKSGNEGNLEPIGAGQIRGILVNDDKFKCDGDYDYDGIPNWKEAGYASLDACDGDGSGLQELPDTDGDGIPDYLDDDSDGDGASDAVEAWSRDNRVTNNNDGKIRVGRAVSPNGDGKGNERMYIENINRYPENEVVLFNRWGDVVYKGQGYNNQEVSFNGRSNAGNMKNEDVPDGVYYYVIYLKNKGTIIGRYTGYIVIKR